MFFLASPKVTLAVARVFDYAGATGLQIKTQNTVDIRGSQTHLTRLLFHFFFRKKTNSFIPGMFFFVLGFVKWV